MPAKAYDVHLDIFEGPLDLLLYLIRKSDLNVYDIPISQITSEYLSYIDLMKEMNLDVAGEFLVMASTLMQMKAHTLLPAPQSEGEEGPDPRAELINRLLEYQRFKEAAKDLHQRYETHREIYYRGNSPIFGESDYHMGTSLVDLMDAFREVLSEMKPSVREVVFEEIPIEEKIREIFTFMEGKPYVTFRELLHLATTRHGLIVTFLAVLELIRLKQVAARQVKNFGEIRVYKVEEGAEVPPVVEEMTAAAQLAAPDPSGGPASPDVEEAKRQKLAAKAWIKRDRRTVPGASEEAGDDLGEASEEAPRETSAELPEEAGEETSASPGDAAADAPAPAAGAVSSQILTPAAAASAEVADGAVTPAGTAYLKAQPAPAAPETASDETLSEPAEAPKPDSDSETHGSSEAKNG